MTTAPAVSSEALITEKEHAVHAWYLFTQGSNLKAIVPDWRTSTSPGTPHLSAEVVGPDAAEALHFFASDYPLVLGRPGDQRPVADYSVPGRVSCVWRSNGVWVELWHPDTQKTTSQSAPAPPRPQGPVFARLSIRRQFTRRSKETTA